MGIFWYSILLLCVYLLKDFFHYFIHFYCKISSCSTFSPTFTAFSLVIQIYMKHMSLIAVLICIFVVTLEHLLLRIFFMCLLTICILSLKKYLLKCFADFLCSPLSFIVLLYLGLWSELTFVYGMKTVEPQSFACDYPVVPAPWVERRFFPPLSFHAHFELTVNIRVFSACPA